MIIQLDQELCHTQFSVQSQILFVLNKVKETIRNCYNNNLRDRVFGK